MHEWCWRHTYLDLVTFGQASKSQAQMATFFFSAVFHELIFSVAFKTLRPWFFLGCVAGRAARHFVMTSQNLRQLSSLLRPQPSRRLPSSFLCSMMVQSA